mgnify:CR=1 FL=1
MKVLVVGDVMVDSYLWGKVDRISPEAPVPVISMTKRESRLGGAANVARNVMALGADPIICSVIGDDDHKALFMELLNDHGFSNEGIVMSKNRRTTIKTRVISQDQHVLRVDEEDTHNLTSADENALIAKVSSALQGGDIDVIILEDYNKGVLTPKVIKKVIALANENNVPTTVDPKKENFFAFVNCTLFKPNLKELVEGTKIDFKKSDREALLRAVIQVESKLRNKLSLITMSEQGVFVKSGDDFEVLPAHPRKIIDVSGAGDTVISVASLALAAGTSPTFIAALSNLAGGLVCEQVGVVPIQSTQLLEEAAGLGL